MLHPGPSAAAGCHTLRHPPVTGTRHRAEIAWGPVAGGCTLDALFTRPEKAAPSQPWGAGAMRLLGGQTSDRPPAGKGCYAGCLRSATVAAPRA